MSIADCSSAPARQPSRSLLASADMPMQLERSFDNRPVFRSHCPQYCFLVFGPEAKTRVWVVLDGDVVHVERDKKFAEFPFHGETDNGQWHKCHMGDVLEPDSNIRHRDLRVIVTNDWATLTLRSDG